MPAIDLRAIEPHMVYGKEDAARLLCVSPRTLRRMVSAGHMTAVRLAGSNRQMFTGVELIRVLNVPEADMRILEADAKRRAHADKTCEDFWASRSELLKSLR